MEPNSLPAYTYIPGLTPRPQSEAEADSTEHGTDELFEWERWASCRAYLRGWELFNHGYYWEAHEVWEAAWLAVGRVGPVADFLKALIKLAAAGVKVREGRAIGVTRHGARAAELLRGVASRVPRPTHGGLNIDSLLALAVRLATDPALPDRLIEDAKQRSTQPGIPLTLWQMFDLRRDSDRP